jgi:hypothetical protein
MEPQPFTVTFQSSQAQHVEHRRDSLVLSHRLPRLFSFDQPHLVKLQLVAGLEKEPPLLVYASFAEPQPFNGEYRPLLGSTRADSNSFIPLAGNFLSGTVTLTLESLNGATVNVFPSTAPGSNFTLGVYVVPASWLRPMRPAYGGLLKPAASSASSSSSDSDSVSPILSLLRGSGSGGRH